MPSQRAFLLILILYLVLALGYAVVVPLGEAPDEADHYYYITYLGENRRLPEGPAVTQGKHPPLYHATAAALSAWTGHDFTFLRSNPDALPLGPDKPPNLFIHTTLESFPWRAGALAMHLARFLSILLGAVTVWAAWRLGLEVFPGRPAIGLLAAAFLAGLPGFLFISGSVNNDNAAAAFGSLIILLCAMTLARGLSWGRTALLGLCLGLGLLSKVGTLALWPLAALAVGGAWWVQRGPTGRHSLWAALGHLALAWGLGLLLAAPWGLRNWRLYGDPFGWELVRATVDQRLQPLALGDIGWLLWGIHRTFWGRFGGAGQVALPAWAWALAGLFTAVVVAGAVHSLIRARRSPAPHALHIPGDAVSVAQARAAVLPWLQLSLLALAPVLMFISIVRYSAIALGTDQARLMFPALVALAVWVGIGLVGLADWARGRPSGLVTATEAPAADRGLVAGFTAAMAVFALVVLVALIRPAFGPPQPLPTADVPAATPLATFGDGLELLAVELPAGPLPAGAPVAVRLVWRATGPLADDLRPALQLVHEDGWLAAEWSHSPAGGRYSTDRWQPGEAIADDYQIVPQPPAPGIYIVQVGVRPFGGDWLPTSPASAAAPFLPLGQVVYR